MVESKKGHKIRVCFFLVLMLYIKFQGPSSSVSLDGQMDGWRDGRAQTNITGYNRVRLFSLPAETVRHILLLPRLYAIFCFQQRTTVSAEKKLTSHGNEKNCFIFSPDNFACLRKQLP